MILSLAKIDFEIVTFFKLWKMIICLITKWIEVLVININKSKIYLQYCESMFFC